MTDRPHAKASSLLLDADQPLIGLMLEEDGQDVVRYFVNDEEVDEILSDDVTRCALDAIGSFGDVDWGELVDALDRIRHETPPTPPIE